MYFINSYFQKPSESLSCIELIICANSLSLCFTFAFSFLVISQYIGVFFTAKPKITSLDALMVHCCILYLINYVCFKTKNKLKKNLFNMPKSNLLIKKSRTFFYNIEVFVLFKSVFHMKIIQFILPAPLSVLA